MMKDVEFNEFQPQNRAPLNKNSRQNQKLKSSYVILLIIAAIIFLYFTFNPNQENSRKFPLPTSYVSNVK